VAWDGRVAQERGNKRGRDGEAGRKRTKNGQTVGALNTIRPITHTTSLSVWGVA